ncbi:MAG: tRNA uridine-5-carboxymethylaminomethyl(34) synthesis GTPase MnmE [Lachnospiraceae bacterium]|nr:tRNA uridine-5-carboxymethylaminomethyl(34) synthesis GTPase MnmE [Lachnospiraceae bacterium]
MLRDKDSDTIAAIATAPGQSGIGVIRISGSEAIALTDGLIFSKSGKKLNIKEQPSHTVKYGFIRDGEEEIDEVLVTVFKKPKSFTAEDTVEISCHGGSFVLRRVLSLIIKRGVRPADPGEFTKRAYLNGRIDLTEAEAVMDIISSTNELARKNSLSVLRGGIYEKIKILRERILHECAFIESALDDPEHYSLEGYPDRLKAEVLDISGSIEELLKSADTGRILKGGIKTAIAGKPNVGKSSILNLLCGESKAIVTDIPGTTRDVLSSEIVIDGIPLILSDTAGIRDTEDVVEKIGVERSRETIDKADLVLFILDSSEDTDTEDKEIYDYIRSLNKRCIVLLNKTDIRTEEKNYSYSDLPCIDFSAREEKGLKELKALIEEMFLSGALAGDEEIFITSERQLGELKSALDSLKLVIRSIDDGMTEDFFTVDLMDSYSFLGNVTGEETDEDLFNKIFSEFCMGK